jgi:23S rRNA (pseudouridine1915-N3)-methyltransferase
VDIFLLAVGKLRPAYREICDDYLKRLRRDASVIEIEVKEASRAPTPAVQQRDEAGRLRERIPVGALVVALDREGKELNSGQLAEQVQRWRQQTRPLVFVLGGSTGLAEELRQAAAFRWSLGPLTLPHELARVLVTEQLYRGMSILRGEPYHK